MAHALWLAGVRDGATRAYLDDPNTRSRIVVPPCHFIRRALTDSGGARFDTLVLQALRSGSAAPWDAVDVMGPPGSQVRSLIPVIALVRVTSEACVSHSGRSTMWHEESQVQLQAYSNPMDAYEIRVVDAHPCHEAEPIFFKHTRQKGAGGVARVASSQPLFRASWPVEAASIALRRDRTCAALPPVFDRASGSVRVADVLRQWGVHEDAQELPVLPKVLL